MSGSTESETPILDVAGLSREGRRASNEDSAAWVTYGPDSSVRAYALVCDGMGGHNAGEVASAMALRYFQEKLGDLAGDPAAAAPDAGPVLLRTVESWVTEVNRQIRDCGASDLERRGMGTTLALAAVVGEKRLVVANVGDSKVFLVRGVQVSQLSVDHTALAEQRRALGHDSVAPEDDAGNPFAHALTRSLGQEHSVVPDVRADLELRPGDLVIVTSDGVTDVLESERFLTIVEASVDLAGIAETIYRLSYEAGSKDNISVALIAHGRPTQLGLAPQRLRGGESSLEETVPGQKPKNPVPVAGGAAVANADSPGKRTAGRSPKRVLSPAVLIGAGIAALLLLVASLYFVLAPGEEENAEAVVDATAAPMPTLPTTPGTEPSPTRAEAAPPEDVKPPSAPAERETPATIKVTTAQGPSPLGKLDSLKVSGEAAPAPAKPRDIPVRADPPRAAAAGGNDAIASGDGRAPSWEEPPVDVKGARLKPREVEVSVEGNRYVFRFRYDRPVKPLPDRSIDFGRIRVMNRGDKDLGEKNQKSYRMTFNGVEGGETLKFSLPESQTYFRPDKYEKRTLEEGDTLKIDGIPNLGLSEITAVVQ